MGGMRILKSPTIHRILIGINMRLFFSILLSILFIFSPSLLGAQFYKSKTSTLTWTANSEEDLAGYKVYRSLNYCTKKQPKTLINTLGKVNTFVDDKIPLGTVAVCYHVTAFDLSGNESGPSNEVDKPIAVAPNAPKWFVPSTPIIK